MNTAIKRKEATAPARVPRVPPMAPQEAASLPLP